MRKIFGIILLILFIVFAFVYFNKKELKEEKDSSIDIEGYAKITNYYIYGNHFNMEGYINVDNTNIDEYELILKNDKKEVTLDCSFQNKDNKIFFQTSSLINQGIDLDALKIGDWYLLIKYQDQYYSFINETDDTNMEYYTMTKNGKNNKIDIAVDYKMEENDYVRFIIKESKLPKDVYDITIDPGHGGIDTGAIGKLNGVTYNEADLALKIALDLKKDLEKKGYKVKITRDGDIDLDNYGENGRAVIPNKYHSKLCLSLHLNSENKKMNYGGLEIYTPNDIDYTLAKVFVSNLGTVMQISQKQFNRVGKGVYFEGFTRESIKEVNEQYQKKNLKTYEIVLKAPEMFMIREVGGRMTHAYVDGRNPSHGLNEYYDANQTAESYLLELGYITYTDDLNIIVNKGKEISQKISTSIIDYYQ